MTVGEPSAESLVRAARYVECLHVGHLVSPLVKNARA
jgi:hypothetical protein